MTRRKIILTAGLFALLVLIGYTAWRLAPASHPADEIALLLPDDVDANAPLARIWLDAAREEGLRVRPLSDTEFLRPGFSDDSLVGIIVPDTIHKVASDPLVLALRSYVRAGGHLLLTYDAGIWQRPGLYRSGRSAFSDLVGVDYGLYSRYKAKTILYGPITGTTAAFDALEIPPGKTSPYTDQTRPGLKLQAISSYEYPVTKYPGHITQGSFRGQTLLTSPQAGLMAGTNRSGRGEVLFVNLPLGYLKSRTDGLFLHSFLRYFAGRVLAVPRTAPVPEGQGGLVMNWHIDSNADIKPLQAMEQLGFYHQGPYSLHITAGPDTYRIGDRAGLDLPHNTWLQNWVRRMQKRGDAIGSHGGWIHNYYGMNVTEGNEKAFVRFLELNKKAVEAATGQPMREYSAPEGNQPIWSTLWLEKNGVIAYYFTGNTGLGPTRSHREGQPLDLKSWSFPIATLGPYASFDEFHKARLSNAEVARWLEQMCDYSVRNRTSRLVYFHPHDISSYPNAMRTWLQYAASLRKSTGFRWYTMTQLASFLNVREQTQWEESWNEKEHTAIFTATNPTNLAQQTWLLPRSRYSQPQIEAGNAEVRSDKTQWLVVARSGKELRFTSAMQNTSAQKQ